MKVTVIGLGPGAGADLTGRARAALAACDLVVGYTAYVALIQDEFPDKEYRSTGMRKEVDRCRAAGERMIVLTSSVPEHCRAALGRLGLTEYFQRILFAHDLGMDKKDPETFRHAAALMGVTPEECTVYDDSVAACRAARDAGMQVVGVYDEFFHVSWPEMCQVCHRVIRSFEELL